MKMQEYLNEEEWKNITPYIFLCKANVCDGLDWQIDISLYDDTIETKTLCGSIGVATAEGIILNRKHRFDLRLISTKIRNKEDYQLTDNAFMIMARKKKNND